MQEDYICQIRRKVKAQRLITLVKFVQYIRRYCANVIKKKEQKTRIFTQIMIYFSVCLRWNQRMRRYGDGKL